MPVPTGAGCHAAGNVNTDKRLTAAWISEYLRQAVCLDVVIHDPLNLRQLQAVSPAELKCQLLTHRPCYALNLVFNRIQPL